jgi:large subunit ribosomal protein L10
LAITRAKKQELIETYVDWLGQSQAAVFVYSRGLTVAQITALRSKIREAGSTYHVVKNTLFRRALAQAEMPVPEFLSGPVSIAFCIDDIAPAVKAIEDFAADLDEGSFEIRGGLVERDVLDAEKAKALASMPSKDMLFTQILVGVNAPASGLATTVTNGLRQILNVLQARVDQLQESEAAA